MSALEEKIRKLEDSALKLKTVLGVVAALGIGLGAFVTYVWTTAENVRNELGAADEKVGSLEQRIGNLNELVDERVNTTVNDKALIASYNHEAVLAQVQAQAVCTAMSPKNNTVMAILRLSTGKDAEGKVLGERCVDICPRFTMIGTGRKASMVGAVHVYSNSLPFTSSDSATTFSGLATHVYGPDDRNQYFGPNYCCCAG